MPIRGIILILVVAIALAVIYYEPISDWLASKFDRDESKEENDEK